MANKKTNEEKNDEVKTTRTKKTTTTKTSTTKKEPVKKKSTSTKKVGEVKTTGAKKTTTKTSTAKKEPIKKKSITTKSVKKDDKVKTTEATNDTTSNDNLFDTTKILKIEKKIDDEINSTVVEDAKFQKNTKRKSLLLVGIFMSLLGLIALIISLIANRIIDREFISDSTISIMIIISILIEIFGAYIIINEA